MSLCVSVFYGLMFTSFVALWLWGVDVFVCLVLGLCGSCWV